MGLYNLAFHTVSVVDDELIEGTHQRGAEATRFRGHIRAAIQNFVHARGLNQFDTMAGF
jgi:hypothetical protein